MTSRMEASRMRGLKVLIVVGDDVRDMVSGCVGGLAGGCDDCECEWAECEWDECEWDE